MNKNIFEDYLMEIHARDYIGTDDDMPDNYEYWLDNVDKNELIEYANKALSQQKQEIIGVVEDYIKNYEYDKEAHAKGECSHPVLAICSAIEQEIKMELSKILNQLKI
jgi:hypothetical protein